MDAFQKKTLKTSRGYTYTYYTADGDKLLPTLIFQHGWPDHAEMWKDVAGPLKSLKHPIIIPDMLGYDGTDKPTNPEEYRWDKMTKDIIEILDQEGGAKAISIGHDWGSAAASRLYNFYPDRVVGLITVNVGYMAPGRDGFDLDLFNKMTEQAFGYPFFMYWHLFTAPDGAEILKNNADRLYHALHGQGETMKEMFCVRDALKNFLLSTDEPMKLRPYAADPKMKQAFIDRMTRDGFEGPQCWYIATKDNTQTAADRMLPEGTEKVNVPVLYVGGKDDAVCRPESMAPMIQAGWLPHLTQEPLFDASHWTPMEVPDQVVAKIEPWLKKNFAQ